MRSFSATKGIRVIFAALAFASLSAPLNAIELKDVQRSKGSFSYYALGHHVPQNSGHRPIRRSRFVLNDSIVLPMKISPAAGEHMYCNSQVYGFGGGMGPAGTNANDLKNYAYPWMDNLCEDRGSKQYKGACPVKRIHQGQDCRPPQPQNNHYEAVAVEKGKIDSVGTDKSHTVRFTGDSQILWKYLHMRDRQPKGPKAQRAKLGNVSNYFRTNNCGGHFSESCTSIHLHLEAWTQLDGVYGPVDVLPSLIVANQKALGHSFQIDGSGDLVFDPRYEIKPGQTGVSDISPSVADCGGALANPSIGTENRYNFSSLWCHNGSVMGLVADGEQRLFVYYKPRGGLAAFVSDDPELFSGRTDNNDYIGEARHYSSRCGNKLFDASGPVAADFRQVSVTGRRKVFDQPGNCAFSFADETLQFFYMTSFDGGAPSGPAVGGNMPSEDSTPAGESTPAPADPATMQPVEIDSSCGGTTLAPIPASVAGKGFANYWFHNCSIVGLADGPGDSRKIYYVRPRAQLVGPIDRQALLFDGAKQGRQYFGETIHFNTACGDRFYTVTGPIDEDGLGVTLSGERPVIDLVDGQCTVSLPRATCLRFTFAAATLAEALAAPLAKEPCEATASEPTGDGRIAIIDTAVNAMPFAERLLESGVVVIGRYFARKHQSFLPEKRFAFNQVNGVSEAKALLARGFSILSIYQYRNNERGKFVNGLPDTGSTVGEARADARAALEQAEIVGQPVGSAIYFGVDFDLSPSDTAGASSVIAYFTEVRRVIGDKYKIGVYGSGLVNRLLRAADLIDYSWVSASVAFADTDNYYNSGNWHLFQNQVDRRIFEISDKCPSGLSMDTNIQNVAQTDFGFWGNGVIAADRKARIFSERGFATVEASALTAAHEDAPAIAKRRCRYLDGSGWSWVADNSIKRVRNARFKDHSADWREADIDDDGTFDGFVKTDRTTADMTTMPEW